MQAHDGKAKYWEVVALSGVGAKTPLFCIPGAGGEVTIFRGMACNFANDQTVCGIDLQKFFATDREFKVEDLADLCVTAIRDTQARGPYHLCGYSFGALVAYEVAIRLRYDGEDVGVLALIDTGNPAFTAKLSSPETKQLQKTYFADRLGKYFRLLTSGKIRTLASSFSALLAARAGIRTRRLIRSVCQATKRPMPAVFRNNDRALFAAWRAYNPPAGALSLLLFYESHRCAEYGGDRTLGWRLSTSGDVEVELGSGGHVEMMKAQNVRSFAAKLIGRMN